MTIRTRGKSLQIDVQITKADGSKVRHRETFKGNQKEAEAREADIQAALLNGRDPTEIKKTGSAVTSLTLAAALEATWERYWRGKGCERTVRSNMKACVEFFGAGKPISEITTTDADDFVDWMKAKGYSASTIRNKSACMTKMLTHYHKRGGLTEKPLFELPAVGDNLRDRVISEAEETALLSLFTDTWDVVAKRREDGHTGRELADLFIVLLDTGFRPSELLAAEEKNLRGRLWTLRKTKTGRSRTIPLTQRALAAVQRQIALHGSTPFNWATPDTIRWAWDWARSTMGLSADDGFVPYALRHTCATRLYAKTRDIVLVKEWLGHTDIKMTLRYAKLQPQDLERACDLLEGRGTVGEAVTQVVTQAA
jgi:integrase